MKSVKTGGVEDLTGTETVMKIHLKRKDLSVFLDIPLPLSVVIIVLAAGVFLLERSTFP